jgi:hypothetical protein
MHDTNIKLAEHCAGMIQRLLNIKLGGMYIYQK